MAPPMKEQEAKLEREEDGSTGLTQVTRTQGKGEPPLRLPDPEELQALLIIYGGLLTGGADEG